VRRPTFYRPCWVELDPTAFRFNFHRIQRIAEKAQVLAVVKANAYGHGLDAFARIAAGMHAAMLGVSSLEEGIQLRQARLKTPVLILGGLFPFENFPALFSYKLTPTLASLQGAQALDRLARRKGRRHPVHLKIDTGFGRMGVRAGAGGAAIAFVRQAAKLPGLVIEGIYTHFASSDVSPSYTRRQHAFFNEVIKAAAHSGIRPRWIHEANSSAILKYPETHGTLVRPGLALYGIAPYAGAEERLLLRPVLSWKTRVIFLKQVPEGFAVSYANTWTAKRPTTIATLAVGYADGYPRSLSNKGVVLVRGKKVPVIGRVTMDMMMVDVTEVKGVVVGDEVVLIGTQEKESILATSVADLAQTNAYEIVSRIAARVPRIYHGYN
jgi:alanine racemase